MTPPQSESAQERLATELATFARERPRLIADGEVGRWALVRGDEIVSVWDTFGDALQAGHERFGRESFLVDQIRSEPRGARVSRLYR